MNIIIARLKSFPRWIAFHLGSKYEEYGELSDVPGYDGWYTWRGHCVAFHRDDNQVQFCW